MDMYVNMQYVNMHNELYSIMDNVTRSRELQSKKIVCAGRALFIPLVDSELIVKVEFVSRLLTDTYNAVSVTIVNNQNGQIDRMLFELSDYSADHKASYIILDSDGDAKWFRILSAEGKAKMADSIRNYIALFVSE